MKKKYILGSHNSWSFLRPQKWWQRLIAFTARCQRVDIQRQYALGVRCFDLRLRTDGNGNAWLAHGLVEYSPQGLVDDLDYLNAQGGCMVRVLHETRRTGKDATAAEQATFAKVCEELEMDFPKISFYGGLDVRSWQRIYKFRAPRPTEDGCYASNMKPHLLDDWWPWLYARTHNRKFREKGTNLDVLVLDFVDI